MEMNTKLKYLPIAAFAAIALTLAGCGGGGGGGGPVASVVEPTDEMVEAAEAAVMAAETAKTALSDAWAAYEMAPSDAGATAITDAAAALVAAAAVLGEAAVDDDQTAAVEGFNDYAALVGAVLDNAGRAVASVEMAAMLAATEAARLAQVALDAANADVTRLEDLLAAAPSTDGDVAAVQTLLDAANADVTRLEAELAAAPTDADVAAVQTMLDDANAEVTRLEAELAAAPTDADVAAVQTMLDDANAEVTRLEVLLAAAPPTTGDVAAIQKLLDDANAEVTRLEGELAAAPPTDGAIQTMLDDANAEVTRLEGELAAAPTDADVAAVQTMLDDANAEVTRLEGELAAAPTDADVADIQTMLDVANAKVTRLETQIGDPADPADAADTASLNAQLNAAKAALATAMVTAINAFETAQNTRDDATGAASTAEKAVTDATEASGKITTLSAVGDSAAAEANAQAVLDARDDADAAVTTAQAAVDDAKTALATVDPAGDYSGSLTRALEAAIEVAEAQLKMATDEAEGDALKAAVALVTVHDPDDDDYPMTPAQHGRAVAMDIDMALSPESPIAGARMRGTHGNVVPKPDEFPDAVTMNDHQGSTWEEIVGAANVSDKRIAEGGGTMVVKAASFAGMALDSFTGSPPAVGEIDDGAQFDTATYNGIPGTAFCAGSDCEVSEVDADDDDESTLTGSWYFTPTSPMVWYAGTTDAVTGVTTYLPEDLYAQFGHWLEDDQNNDTAEVMTYARTDGNTRDLVLTVNTEVDAAELTDTSASYRGPAAGMSVYQTVNMDGTINTMQSAAFTATVNLEATFGGNPTLGGTVTDFQGDATDSRWSVKLLATGFDTSASTVTNGVTVASSPRGGVWTATSYGPTGGRPTGIFGGFNAHFSDGHAAGAYATRK